MVNSSAIYHLRYIFIALLVVLIADYAMFTRQYDSITWLQAGYGILIVMLGALPGVVALLNKREANLIPLMPLHGIFYAVTFGLPVLSNKTIWLAGGESQITDALMLTILGLLCLYFGYYVSRWFIGDLKPVRSRKIPLQRQIRVGWILFGFYLLLEFFPALKSLPSMSQLSTPLGYLSLGILTLLVFSHRLPRRHVVSVIVAVVLTLGIKLLSGSLAPVVHLIIFLGILYWNKKRRIPWNLVFIIVLVAVVLNPIKQQYRDLTWYASDSSLSYYDKILLLGSVAQEYYSSPDILFTISEDSSTVNRLAHISTFSYVINMTPASVPYWSGDSYHTLWTSFIPRALWPGKPHATIGQDFGHRYSLIRANDTRTSINLPWLLEFYVNFGTLGVLLGMFLVGVFFRFLVQKFRVPVSAPLEHVLAVTITFTLYYAESNFALMAGGILTIYIALFVLLRLLSSR